MDAYNLCKIGEKIVSYNLCSLEYKDKNPTWIYLGKGVIYSIMGYKQSGKHEFYFWVKA